MINGNETTDHFDERAISQSEYSGLTKKELKTLYKVQPLDTESAPVHFLGDTPVDMTKDENGKIIYTRNWLVGTSSDGILRSKGKIIDFTNKINGAKNGSNLSFQCTMINQKKSNVAYKIQAGSNAEQTNQILIGEEGFVSCSVVTNFENTSEIYLEHLGYSSLCKKEKLALCKLEDIGAWTIAPEDLLGSK